MSAGANKMAKRDFEEIPIDRKFIFALLRQVYSLLSLMSVKHIVRKLLSIEGGIYATCVFCIFYRILNSSTTQPAFWYYLSIFVKNAYI